MKTSSLSSSLLAIACAVLIQGTVANAQDSMTTTTSTVTSDGVVQQIIPTSSEILVTSSASATPVKYTFTKTTSFVDAAGNQVTYESIKQNTPARIYYTKVGDSYVVTKFVVQAPAQTTTTITPVAPVTTVVPATPVVVPVTPAIEETTTTTTTTKSDD